MPIARKKSCAQCRQAKARCNLGRPICSRCTERALQCNYGDAPPSTPDTLSTAHHVQPMQLDDIAQTNTGSPGYGQTNNFEFTEQNLSPFGLEHLGWPTPTWSDATLPRSLATPEIIGGISEESHGQASTSPSNIQSPDYEAAGEDNFLQTTNDDLDLLIPRPSLTAVSFISTRIVWA